VANVEKPVTSLAISESGRSFEVVGPTVTSAQCWTKAVLVKYKK